MRHLVCLTIVAILATACTEPGGLRLVASVDRTSVVASDSVRVSLTLTNQSSRPKSVSPAEAYGICNHAFQVLDAANREVAVQTAFCAAALIYYPGQIELEPGASIAITDWWNPSTSLLNGQPLGSGLYRLQGRVWGDERTILSAPVGIVLE